MVYIGVCSLAVLIDSCYQQSLSEVGNSLHHHSFSEIINFVFGMFELCPNILAIGDFAIFQNYESLKWQQVEVKNIFYMWLLKYKNGQFHYHTMIFNLRGVSPAHRIVVNRHDSQQGV